MKEVHNLYKRNFLLYILPSIIIVILIAIYIFQGIGAEKALDSEVFDQKMYCVEVLEDGTAIPVDSFIFRGKMCNTDNGKRSFQLDPFTISGSTISTMYYHHTLPTLYTVGEEFHVVRVSAENASGTSDSGAVIYLKQDLQYCKIETDGRCFVASTKEDFDCNDILAYFAHFYPDT